MGHQFSSVYTTEDTADLPDLGPSNTQSAPPINVEAKGIQILLKDLKPHKASGPDSIPARLLKTAADELAQGLAHLFQISIDNEKIPPWTGRRLLSHRFSRRATDQTQETTVQFLLPQLLARSWNMLSTAA